MKARPTTSHHQDSLTDEQLFGWDPTSGIVSVWAAQTGTTLVWQRNGSRRLAHSRLSVFQASANASAHTDDAVRLVA